MALNFTFAYVPGFFEQDDLNADPNVIGALPDRFGLLDSGPEHWETFKTKIEDLDLKGGPQDSIKVFFLGRHGEGFHNVVEANHGTSAWNDYWSKLDRDGTLVWGPDALLTPLGIQQAEATHDKWLGEVSSGIPVPTVFYSSPLTRASRTLEITWTDIIFPSESHHGHLSPNRKVVVVEKCRETSGVHICDKRHPKSWIAEKFPLYTFEKGFTEEDEFWSPDVRETRPQVSVRALSVLQDVWDNHPADTYISITSHRGFINGLLRAVGRGAYILPTGGVLPIVIRRTAS